MDKFFVELFSPDGHFTAEEVKDLINRGVRDLCVRDGIAYRMIEPTVIEIKEGD